MSRRPRIEQAGFHHLINRGVAKTNIFLKPQDYEKFLQIVLEAKERYDFIVHSLCLMSNHYQANIFPISKFIPILLRNNYNTIFWNCIKLHCIHNQLNNIWLFYQDKLKLKVIPNTWPRSLYKNKFKFYSLNWVWPHLLKFIL